MVEEVQPSQECGQNATATCGQPGRLCSGRMRLGGACTQRTVHPPPPPPSAWHRDGLNTGRSVVSGAITAVLQALSVSAAVAVLRSGLHVAERLGEAARRGAWGGAVAV